jgi:hypothetical protein
MGRRGCARGLELELLCSCLVDSPPVGRGRCAWSRLDRCSSCSSLVLACLSFDLFCLPSSVARSLADGLPGVRGQSAAKVWRRPRCLAWHGEARCPGAAAHAAVLASAGQRTSLGYARGCAFSTHALGHPV